MSVRNQLKLLVGGLSARRGGRPPTSSAPSAMGEFLERSRLVAALIFICTVAAIALISSVGVSTLDAPLVVGQVATSRVTALVSFNYESAERTRAAREQFLDRVPPVYRLDLKPLQLFDAAAHMLLTQLAALETANPGMVSPLLARRAELARIAETFNSHSPTYNATAEDIAAVLAAGDAKTRAEIFENGLATLRDVYAQGVTDSGLGNFTPGSGVVFQIARPNGDVAQRPVQSLEDALTALRVSLAAGNVPRPAAQAIFRVFRMGLTPNIVFDREKSYARSKAAASAVKPVMVHVDRGQIIVEAGKEVTPEQHEMLVAQRRYLREHGDEAREGLTLFRRVLLVLLMVFASLIYIRIEDPETLRSNVRCGLLALVVIVNLALVRANYSLGGAEFFLRDPAWASTLPYVAPTAFAPLIVAILIDAGSGIFMALLISIFTGVIYGNRLDLLVLTFLASLVTIFFGRDARRRGRVVRAAGAGGVTVAAFAALIGLADETTIDTLLRQMTAGVATGVITGIGVVGLLPVLESLFKRTTDITLLELTDYNHPLLRHMQLEAPGPYHHSLVVAQLSENAANAIGANPLLARVCALFHDVGKTIHPQYFAENHRDRSDPHAELSPAESARVIKQHVPDGVELAQKHHLPRAVIDVIQQHHGTTLVRYFYQRAIDASRAPFAKTTGRKPSVEPTAPVVAFAPPDEHTFRYEGPKPQFKESAIISLADGVEATSRSMSHPSAETTQEMINRIIDDRIADGQLDEAPLTLEEITRIKNSFQFTLLNMLHSRIAYPPVEKPSAEAKA